MAERIIIDADNGIVIGAISETVFNERVANFATILQSVKDEIAAHQAEIELLDRKKKAIEEYIADAGKVTEIIDKMKIREAEGIQ